MLSFQLNKMTYLSNQLFLYMPTEVSVHHLFIFLPVYHAHLPANSSACPHTHRATYPKLNVAAHFDAFLPANHENLPVDSTARPHTHGCNRFSFYLFILKLSFRLTANTYLPTHLRHYISTAPLPPPPHTHTLPPQFTKLHAHFHFSVQAQNERLPDNSSSGYHRPTRK